MGLGVLSWGLGVLPQGLGVLLRGLGVLPRGLGTFPRCLGALPRGLGALPRRLPWPVPAHPVGLRVTPHPVPTRGNQCPLRPCGRLCCCVLDLLPAGMDSDSSYLLLIEQSLHECHHLAKIPGASPGQGEPCGGRREPPGPCWPFPRLPHIYGRAWSCSSRLCFCRFV